MEANESEATGCATDDEISCLFRESVAGDELATARLIAHVYDRIRTYAQGVLRHHPMIQTLSATAVANEVYIKLASSKSLDPRSEEHFFAIAANATCQVVRDYCKHKRAQKAGGEWTRVLVDPSRIEAVLRDVDVDDLREALDALRAEHPDLHRVVMLRLFTDKSTGDIARMLGLPRPTVDHRWRGGKAWLRAWLAGEVDA